MANILIVDDSAFMRNMVKDILVQEGHTIVGEAADGDDAIAKYKELRPEIVTMDVVMPGTDGIDAVRGIIESDPNAKIIMCSALGQREMVVDALEAGAKDYIVKPFQPLMVKEVVKKILLL
ncbi:MAG: response regulator [Candidatus Hydrothermarchaeales archaeon]